MVALGVLEQISLPCLATVALGVHRQISLPCLTRVALGELEQILLLRPGDGCADGRAHARLTALNRKACRYMFFFWGVNSFGFLGLGLFTTLTRVNLHHFAEYADSTGFEFMRVAETKQRPQGPNSQPTRSLQVMSFTLAWQLIN